MHVCVCMCVCSYECLCVSEHIEDKNSYRCAQFTFCRPVDNLNSIHFLCLFSQSGILTDGTHTVEIKVDPPADNQENTVSGNVRLFS